MPQNDVNRKISKHTKSEKLHFVKPKRLLIFDARKNSIPDVLSCNKTEIHE